MSRLRALVRGLVSLTVLAVIVAGLPWALVRWGELPGTPNADWWDRLGDGAMSDSTVFVVLTLAAWSAWAVFTISVVVETIAGLRGVHAPRLAFAGPLQHTARGLVVGVLLLLSIAQQAAPVLARPTPASGASLFPRAAVSTVVDITPPGTIMPATGNTPSTVTDDAEPPPPPSVGESVPAREIVVATGDNPWSLAERHLGNGLRWRDLWKLNQGVPQPDGRAWTDPETILAGWHLRLPDSPAAAEPTSAPADTEPSPAESTAPAVVHVVIRGDTLSGIAAAYLGDPDRYPELYELNRDRVQPDGRYLSDANVIVPGWQIQIPVVAPPTAVEVPADAPGEAAADPAPVDVAPVEPPVTPVPTGSDTEATSAPPPTNPAPSTTTTSTAAPPSTTTGTTQGSNTVSTAPTGTADESDTPGSASVLPAVAGTAGVLVISTGIMLKLRWLRRRRATRGARHGHVPPTPVEQAALAAADVPLVRWAGQHLARLVGDLRPRAVTAAPVAVELSHDAGIEVLWDEPQHAPPPAGWTSADGGWAWRRTYDPDESVPADELPAAIPALVTIGERDGRQLLVDLEAFGSLTVDGPGEHVDEFLRSIAVELGCGEDLSDAYVTAVDLSDVDGLGAGRRLNVADVDTAIAAIGGTRESIRQVLEHAHVSGTFGARVSDSTPIEATVVIARNLDSEQLARLTAIADARTGIAVVAAATTPGPAHIYIDDTASTARLEPLGVTFTPAGIPAATMDALHVAVAELAALPDLPDDRDAHDRTAPAVVPNGDVAPHTATVKRHRSPLPTTVEFDPHAAPINGNGHLSAPTTATDSDHEPGASLFDTSITAESERMVVRVLGVPAIPDRPGIGPRELIVAVLLACRDGAVAASTAQDAVWPGKALEVKTAWNLYAKTRRALGAFADGTPVMPSADRARGMLRLDQRVTTDVAVLHGLVEEAAERSSVDAIALLRDGLALVQGPPFDGAGFDWAHRDQDVADASALIERAVDMLVDLALQADDIDVAREAVTRGLRGLPGDEQLYRRRMRLEARAGNHAGVVAAYDELTTHLAEFDTQPAAATSALYHELIRAPHGGGNGVR
ncbi:MAG TPA: BTAD domain-containing putative transcriptional regulator [Ilumatobacter sp.]|nr:BTAD domain-containing putative transcriptional regulator [Ilumatobacter sp.]